ncbi:phage tail protein [Novosphingobium sp. PY1]|uniref:gp53-like domain-containing protein n=1 Tax=Novosphingobium sp. PY1 TaxID=1882221 RepID=UPI001A8CDC2C|nr:phage tail protein [Novosphingobium sp. PY1]GFM28147.1 uncharacterized protein PY1_contig-04-195 [Novosphingobium sp. PY1]
MGLTLTVTNAGRAALVNASNTGTAPVTIAQVGLTGTAVTPDPAATALPGEFKRIATLSGDVVADDTIHLIVRDETGDVFTVRSLALYLGDGTLFAIYGQADVLVEKSAQALMLLAIDVQFADVDATDLTFGDANFLNPPATTEQMGVVELSTLAEAIGGTSQTRVPAEKMVKDAVNAWLDARFGANNAGIWHPGNDGAGSGLDADLLDGQQGSWYSNIPARLGYNPVQQGTGNGQLAGNVIKIGWSSASRLKATVDVTDQGNLVTDPYLAGGGLGINGAYMNRAGNALWGPDNDGAGSGLDADLLDGLQSSAFARRDGVNLGPVNLRIDDADFIVSDGTDTPSHYIWRDWDTSTLFIGTATAQPKTRYDLFTDQGNRYWHAGNDGSGSGLDADLLDGYQGSAFARVSQPNTFTSTQVIDAAGNQLIIHYAGSNSPSTILRADTSNFFFLLTDAGTAPSGNFNGLRPFNITLSSGLVTMNNGLNVRSSLAYDGNTVWHAGNDGSGSGLDADLLDGQHGSYYARNDAPNFTGTQIYVNSGLLLLQHTGTDAYIRPTNANGNLILGAGNTNYFTISSSGFVAISGGKVWHAGNDGSGSGLDADLLDGAHASWFADIPARLGYTPVQQGGGIGQGTNKIYVGWSGARLKATVDSTDQGALVTEPNLNGNVLNIKGASMWRGAYNLWGPDNDGAGSGLDADLLDGLQASAFAKMADFAGDLSAGGYQKLPGGLVLQWVRGASGASEGSQALNWPLTFTAVIDAFVSTSVSYASSSADVWFQLVGSPSNNGCTVMRGYSGNTGEVAAAPVVFALGRI